MDARHERLDIRDGQPLDLLLTAAWLQHHAVPTRLLDVTKDPLVAAFFATERDATPDSPGAVIAIRVPRWHRVRFDAAESGSLNDGLRFFNVRKNKGGRNAHCFSLNVRKPTGEMHLTKSSSRIAAARPSGQERS